MTKENDYFCWKRFTMNRIIRYFRQRKEYRLRERCLHYALQTGKTPYCDVVLLMAKRYYDFIKTGQAANKAFDPAGQPE